jgi:hypothetical protein
MMDSKSVRNMYSTLSNKFEKLYISLALIVRIYCDARSSECHILTIDSFNTGGSTWMCDKVMARELSAAIYRLRNFKTGMQ